MLTCVTGLPVAAGRCSHAEPSGISPSCGPEPVCGCCVQCADSCAAPAGPALTIEERLEERLAFKLNFFRVRRQWWCCVCTSTTVFARAVPAGADGRAAARVCLQLLVASRRLGGSAASPAVLAVPPVVGAGVAG